MNDLNPNVPTQEADALFQLEAVSFAVPERTLLHPLTISLPKNRIIGLIGHNGSGKSTLLKILARQQPVSGGGVRFSGRVLSQWSSRDFARKLAYLPQYTPNGSGLLVRELVALGRYPWHGPLGRFAATDQARVEEAMALAKITGMADRLVDTLSGGERQRVWLAMLIAQDAECLLLDEPISALDVVHQIEVLSLVHGLSRLNGNSVIVVLHDINMAARFCDEIVALHSGHVIARGTPTEIVSVDQLKQIYGLDMDVISQPGSGAPVAIPR